MVGLCVLSALLGDGFCGGGGVCGVGGVAGGFGFCWFGGGGFVEGLGGVVGEGDGECEDGGEE